MMHFSETERRLLLATPFVGPKVIERLEEIGICNFEQLQNNTVDTITHLVANMLGTSCWKNSPQSKKAIQNAIDTAKRSIAV